ncbi:MAG: zinc-binding dehydrogenase [Roseiflexaceae bacterium]|nr:zinc-binding dehydrogenase [Roseiflexaceae bacterium]
MKALVFDQHGGLETLRIADLPVPQPGSFDALVRVHAAALNHLDLHTRRGIPGLKLPLPHVGGSDVAGVVGQVGSEVGQEWLGRRVIINPALACGRCSFCRAGEQSLCDQFKILGEHTTGGFAEYIVVPATNLYAIPNDYSFEQAAAVPLAFQTAWRALIGQAKLKPGERVAILGAGGGVATAAIQIAKLTGAYVYAITSTPEKEQRARDLGADETINYRNSDFAKELWQRTGKRGVHVVLENVGPATWGQSVRSLARGGRLVTFGATTGRAAETDLNLLFFKQLHLIGSTMANYAEFDAVMGLVFSGKLRPVVDRVLRLDDGIEAQRLLESGEQFGKIVLEVAGEE